jgi:hypothetical protein
MGLRAQGSLGLFVVDEVDDDLLPVRDIGHVGTKLGVVHKANLLAENLLASIPDGEQSLVRGNTYHDGFIATIKGGLPYDLSVHLLCSFRLGCLRRIKRKGVGTRLVRLRPGPANTQWPGIWLHWALRTTTSDRGVVMWTNS